jgi:hypothetical protein
MFRFSVLASAALMCVGAYQADATTLYSTGNDGADLYTIDSDTGAGTHIGAFGFSSTYALAFDGHLRSDGHGL